MTPKRIVIIWPIIIIVAFTATTILKLFK